MFERKSLRRAIVPLTTLAATATLLSGGIIAPVAAAPGSRIAETAVTEDLGSRFTLAVVPDTQFYSRYSATQFVPKYGTDPFEVQTRWIAEHRDELNIAFTTHLGDVVDQEWEPDQWVAADRAVSVLDDAGLPYSILPGNHDVSNPGARTTESSARNYLANFPASRLEKNGHVVSTHQNGLSSAHVFEAEGQRFLQLAIGWNSDASTWVWAQSVLDANPTLPTIMTSHHIIGIDDATGEGNDSAFGLEMWDSLIRKNDQIFVTMNGHIHGQTNRVVVNDAGNEVHQILLDSQMEADGGNGVMAIMEFDLTADRIDFATISPWVPLKDDATLMPTDAPVIDAPRAQYSLDIDFAERFAGFNSEFSAGSADEVDLSERAKAIVSDGWEGVPDLGDRSPGSREDYLAVDGTVAHWRFGDQPDGVVAENTAITDEMGGSPMYRLPLDQTNSDEELDDMTVSSADVPALSADGSAMCFQANKASRRLSYLTTEYEAPATRPDLARGYTIETFVHVPETWDAATESWTQFLSRAGRRSALPVTWESAEYEQAPAFFGITNLSEFQFSTTNGRAWTNTTDVWSGAVAKGAWYHVALVNDTADGTLDMYVNGIRQVRSTTGMYGMTASDGYPWIIGANTAYDEATNGWNGCVGETRVVDHPLDPSEFLTNRIDIDGTGANFALETPMAGTFPADTTFARIVGSGYPGATVRLERIGQDDVIGEATVAEDGSWTMDLPQPIAGSGAIDLEFVQSIGTRDGVPHFVTTIIADPEGPTGPVVTTSTTGRLLAGKAYLSVVVRNEDAMPVDITIDTPHGSKTFTAVQPGKAASVAFNSRAAAYAAGEATVMVSAVVDGSTVSREIPVAYAGFPQ